MIIHVVRVHLEEGLKILIKRIQVSHYVILWGLIKHWGTPISCDDLNHYLIEQKVWKAAICDSRSLLNHWEWPYKETVRGEILIEEIAF
jgi:hypothetical protein